MAEEIETVTENQDDLGFILRAKKDPAAFKPLYEKYYKRIFVFIFHRTGDKSLTADLTSQVFLKAMLGINKFEYNGAPFSAWLFRIALNECYDFFRKSKRVRIVSMEDHQVEQLHEELVSETRLIDLHRRLPAILEKLSVDELHLLELRFFEQKPFKEVAEILDITETYAKVKVYRLLDKMRKIFLQFND